ncbi:MAG TPA: SRPBCC domain-containing protein [Propionibacteriaceae bacterium]|jgi:uncharacterized protein YndB with AHSA1/START domain|nr:SRPBCC domain-containing protein [Propionibacteriaceae bacterium]
MDDELDRIDRQIDIDASAERVWDLVARPGWYINQGTVVSNPVLEGDGAVTVLRHPEYGDWRFRTITLDRPRYAAFRWLGDNDQSTLVEFWITDRNGAGVTLRVVESGFIRLGDADWMERRKENIEGWRSELAAAAAYANPKEVHRAVDVAAPPERVWPLLTTAEGLATWYAFDGATVDPRTGGALSFTWAEHGTYRGRVEEVDRPRTFAFRLAATPDTDPTDGGSTLVTITVESAGDGSTVIVRHLGFDRLDHRLGEASALAAAEVAGWEGGLGLLAQVAAGAGVPM